MDLHGDVGISRLVHGQSPDGDDITRPVVSQDVETFLRQTLRSVLRQNCLLEVEPSQVLLLLHLLQPLHHLLLVHHLLQLLLGPPLDPLKLQSGLLVVLKGELFKASLAHLVIDSIQKEDFLPAEENYLAQNSDFFIFVHFPFVLNSEEKSFENEGNDNCDDDHGEQVERHEEYPAELRPRDRGVALHDDVPVVDDHQLEESHISPGQIVKVIPVVVAEGVIGEK